METNFTQQEILLMTGTSFAAGQLDQKDETDHLSERQRLEEACWNGMLRELLPEICTETGKKMYLWRIKERQSFLDLELGETPSVVDVHSSIDPYMFMSVQRYN